jgi:uncharacterized protein
MYWWIALAVIGSAIIIFLFLYLFRYEPTNFKLSNISININKSTAAGPVSGQNGETPILTILHLSDFHLRKGYKGGKLFDFVQSLAGKEYDLIFITGDMVENLRNVDYLINMLKPLKARYGKYAVLGVHDHYDKALHEFAKNMFKRKRNYNTQNDASVLGSKLKEIGIEVLENENRILNIPGLTFSRLEIIGIGDPVIEKTDLYKVFKDIDPLKKEEIIDQPDYEQSCKKTFRQSGESVHQINDPKKLRISLIHTPDAWVLSTLAIKNTDIVFAGHTHGGQVRLPFIGAIISGCRLETRFASGIFYLQKMVLYISRGLGEGRYSPFRFNCSPEASIITIKRTN